MASVTGTALARGAPVAAARPRLLYVDNIRTVLITLVVVGHLAITYGGGVGDWYYKEAGAASELFVIIMLPLAALLNASLLGLFCFIAGYFTPRAYERKGAGHFLLERLRRLAVPLAVYELILNPLINYVRDVHQGSFRGSFPAYLPVYFSPLRSIADGPVWFLLMLLLFSLAYVAWRLLAAGRGRPRLLAPPGNGSAALFALALGIVTFAVRLWAPFGALYEPWHQEPAHYPQYIGMFVAGILAYRGDWLAAYPAARARLWRRLMPLIVVALIGVAAAAGAFGGGALDERTAGGWNWLSLAYSLWETWTCVAVTIVVLTWFRGRFDRQGPLAQELAAGAFAVYIIHPAVIVPLCLALSGITLNLSLKFLLVTPVALALCYLAAALLRRLPGVRSVL